MEKQLTREEVADSIRKEGYNVSVENGVIILQTDDPAITYDRYKDMLLQRGYHCSFGMKLSGAAASLHLTNEKTPVKAQKAAHSPMADRIASNYENSAETLAAPSHAILPAGADTLSFDYDENGQMRLF